MLWFLQFEVTFSNRTRKKMLENEVVTMPPNTIGSWYTINLPVQYNARKRGLGATVDITSSKTNLPIPVKPAKYDHHVIFIYSVDGTKVSILSLVLQRSQGLRPTCLFSKTSFSDYTYCNEGVKI